VEVTEPERAGLVSWLFLRLFGTIYIAAFASSGVQVLWLVGHDGILPRGQYLSAARQGWGMAAYWRDAARFYFLNLIKRKNQAHGTAWR
jgi:hypothetical protein